MIKIWLCLTIIAVVLAVGECQYEDVRCKCICLDFSTKNGTEVRTDIKRLVFKSVVKEPSECKCDRSVPADLVQDRCNRCECKWERRNTTTIKVVVIIIIGIVSLLFLYMLFLLCLDPLMSRRPKTYLEQQNEEVNLDTQSVHREMVEDGATARQRPGTLASRVRHEVNRVKGEQQKWKGTVQEQRRNIYDRHTMLN